MAYKATAIPVMIASPGDVHSFRIAARDAILEWNSVHSVDRSTVLIPVAWETNASPELTAQAQDLINDRLLADCDLLVAVFWTKLGTPTERANSGTVEEIQAHVSAGKPAMVYFCKAPLPQPIDTQQYERLQEFIGWCRKKGLVSDVKDEYEFKYNFSRQLQQALRSNPHLKKLLANSSASAAQSAPDITLRRAAVAETLQNFLNKSTPNARAAKLLPLGRDLLFAMSEHPSGMLACVETSSHLGLNIQVGNKNFLKDGSTHRDVVAYKAAIRQLHAEGYISPRDPMMQLFEITAAGYEMVDFLRSVG